MKQERTLIGRGRVSEIYTDGFYAYKTFQDDYPESWKIYEVKIHQEIKHKTSLRILNYLYLPETGEIQMDVIKGVTLAYRMRTDKYKHGLEDMMDIQKTFYQYHDLDLPDGYQVFHEDIKQANVDETLKDVAYHALSTMERSYELCHCDFHLDNVLYDGKDYIVIDWLHAKRCHRAFDIARSYLLLKQYVSRKSNIYLRTMMKDCHIHEDTMSRALIVMALVRMRELENDPYKEVLKDLIINLKPSIL